MPILKGKSERGRKIVLYGGPGLGKSTMASQAPNSVFVPTEDGLADIECDHFPVAKKLPEWEGYLGELAKDLQHKQLNIDSGTGLESLIWAQLCEEDSVGDIAAYGKGYGRGYKASLARFDLILKKLDWFLAKNVNVCFICHDSIVTVEDPVHGNYSQATLRMHDSVRDRMIEWADEVLYLTPKIAVNEETERASGGGIRVLKTNFHPAYRAKARCKCPDVIEVPHPDKGSMWDAYWKYVK